MKNIYEYYISQIEKLITPKQQELSENFNNARNINTAVAESYEKERNIFNKLVKNLTAEGLGNFFRDFQIALDLDKNITEKAAFEKLLFEHEDIEVKVGILAEFYASKKIMEFIEDHRKIKDHEIEQGKSEKKILPPIWNGNNKTEFMQLFEGLYRLDKIKPRPNQGKWDLIREIADYFGVELSKNDISNLGKGNNSKYVPKILHDLKTLANDLHDTHVETHRVITRK
jgi:hypothetical protein